MQKLCKYAQDKSIGVCINVICEKTGEFCPMIRYCTLEQRPVMNSEYNRFGCKLKIDSNGVKMTRKRTIKKVEQPIFDKVDIAKEVVCKVNFSKNNKTSLRYSLDGNFYNITVNGVYRDTVMVKYKDHISKDSIISVTQL